MYKGKRVIIQSRPRWKHPIFPWGVYSLKLDKFSDDVVDVDGYFCAGDGGGGEFYYDNSSDTEANGGTIIEPINFDGRYYKIYRRIFKDSESLIKYIKSKK